MRDVATGRFRLVMEAIRPRLPSPVPEQAGVADWQRRVKVIDLLDRDIQIARVVPACSENRPAFPYHVEDHSHCLP